MSENPYQSTETDSTPLASPVMEQPSSVPKVFGIIHLVYAGLGMIGGLMGLANPALAKFTTGPILEIAKKSGKSTEAYESAVAETARYAMINGVVQIALAILLLIAGLNLIKYQLKGAKLSKIWALARIPLAIVFSFLSMDATKRMMTTQNELIGTGNPSMDNMMETMGTVGIVFGILMVSVYPILTLIFLSRAKVMASLK
ncbi:MAG: hypothetical protein ACN4GG_05950 [Akkermansiaceae bacterium]